MISKPFLSADADIKSANSSIIFLSSKLIFSKLTLPASILEKSRIKDKKDIERISREIKILKKVRHPNVI